MDTNCNNFKNCNNNNNNNIKSSHSRNVNNTTCRIRMDLFKFDTDGGKDGQIEIKIKKEISLLQ